MPSSLVLFVVLAAVLLLTDPMGFLSTDVGGKMATLEAMHRNGGFSPDLGYWAEGVDPDGSLYPMWSTAQVGDKWVNATSLPMLLLAKPLYSLGGAMAAGLLPVAGTVLAALGARALARQLGDEGTAAFWLVGLASPATIYALDFWEHSLGLAAMVWAVVLILSASRPSGSWWAALGAGLLFGVAASMRQEALVYGFVAGVALTGRLAVGGRLIGAGIRGAATVAGLGIVTLINSALETAIIGDATRASRSSGTAAAAGGDIQLRIEEAIITFAAPSGRNTVIYLLVALIGVGLLVELGRRAADAEQELRLLVIGLAGIAAMSAVGFIDSGLAFIPGLAATTPVAILAISHLWRNSDIRFVGAIAIVSLPLVWAVQFTGGAAPQWGGRYILLTGALLLVVATVTMTEGRSRDVLRYTAMAGVAVTLVGVAWTIERTHSFADAVNALADRDEPALVFHDPHLAREGGVLVLDEQWLVATGETARQEVADALGELDIEQIGFVHHDRGDVPLLLPGWEIVDETRVPLVSGLYLLVTTQEPIG